MASEKTGDYHRYLIAKDLGTRLGRDDEALRAVALSRLEAPKRRLLFVAAAGVVFNERRRRERARQQGLSLDLTLDGKEPPAGINRPRRGILHRCRIPQSVTQIAGMIDLAGKTRRLDRWSELTHLNIAGGSSSRTREEEPEKGQGRGLSYTFKD